MGGQSATDVGGAVKELECIFSNKPPYAAGQTGWRLGRFAEVHQHRAEVHQHRAELTTVRRRALSERLVADRRQQAGRVLLLLVGDVASHLAPPLSRRPIRFGCRRLSPAKRCLACLGRCKCAVSSAPFSSKDADWSGRILTQAWT